MGLSERVRAAVKGLAALVAVVAVVAAVPLALASLAGNPLPAGIPDLEQLRRALTEGDVADRTLVKILATVCWLAWLQLVAVLLSEVVSVITGRVTRRIPAPRAFHSVAALLIGWIVTIGGSGTGTADTATVSLRVALASQPVERADATSNGLSPVFSRVDAPGDADLAPTGDLPVTEDAGTTPPREYVVVRRDTLWGIARSHLGDPFRWPEIFELNRDRPQSDGRALTDPDLIIPGWRLVLPGDQDPGVEAPLGTPDAEADTLPAQGTVADRSSDPVESARQAEAAARAADAEAQAVLDGLSPALRPDAPARATPETGAGSRVPDPPSRVPDDRDGRPAEHDSPAGGHGDGEHPGDASDEALAEVGPETASMSSHDDPLHGLPGSDPDVAPDTAPATGPPRIRLPVPHTWPDLGDGYSPINGEIGVPDGGSGPTDDTDPSDGDEGDTGHTGDNGDTDISSALPLSSESTPPLRSGTVAAGLSGAALLAGGLAWSISRQRDREERQRQPGEAPRTPSDTERSVEMSLRTAADPDLVEFVDIALRAFVSRLEASGRAVPGVVGVNVDDVVSILFDRPVLDPVRGFALEDDGYSWTIERGEDRLDLRRAAAGQPAPFPALVTLGHTSRSEVLLNLTHTRSLSVTGAGIHVDETLTAMAVELVTGPWSSGVDVVLVGFGNEQRTIDGIEVLDDLDDLADLGAERFQAEPATGLRRPCVVLCGGTVEETALERLLALAASPVSGVTAVVGADCPTAWRVDVDAAEVRLEPVGVVLRRHHLDARVLRPLPSLLAATAAADPRPVELHSVPDRHDPSPVAPETSSVDSAAHGDSTLTDRTPELEVRMLGLVEVRGGAHDLRRRKALELVVHLAFHRQGVDPDTLAEALWPDRMVHPGTLHTMVSSARRSLGLAADGEPYLPPVTPGGLYRLRPEVGLDYERFTALVASSDARHDGDHVDVERAIRDLRSALALVRGRPFTVPGGEYLWVHGEALMSAVVADITDAAHRLARLYLDIGNPRGAWWATGQGLLASPANEQLHRDRMMAAARMGDRAVVAQVMEELCRAIDISEDERSHVLHPETIELYQHVMRRAPTPTLVADG